MLVTAGGFVLRGLESVLVEKEGTGGWSRAPEMGSAAQAAAFRTLGCHRVRPKGVGEGAKEGHEDGEWSGGAT